MNSVPCTRSTCLAAAVLFGLLNFPGAAAYAVDASLGPTDTEVERLPALTVTGTAAPIPDQYQLPQTTRSTTAAQMDDTVNAVDVEDAVKYFPSLFLRKRNYGDNQPVLATRTWGVNSSARTLVLADGVLLSALIANNNTIGAPRWGMVAPTEIDRIDVMYGPFAAAYPGNSIGAVMEITTRMPDKLEVTLTQTEAFQTFSIYSTRNDYPTDQSAVTVGNRVGKWSFWVSANDEYTHTQPLTFGTAPRLPAGTTGGIIAWNKLGQAADLLGASSIQVSNLVNAKVKAAYDFTPMLRATYTLGFWDNHTNATSQTYLRDASGQATFAGVAGFASGFYNWVEEHSMQSLALKSSGKGDWDWQAVGSLYNFDKDTQKLPSTVSAAGTAFGAAGKVAILGGTGWSTLDLKAAWHPDGATGDRSSASAPMRTNTNWSTRPTTRPIGKPAKSFPRWPPRAMATPKRELFGLRKPASSLHISKPQSAGGMKAGARSTALT